MENEKGPDVFRYFEIWNEHSMVECRYIAHQRVWANGPGVRSAKTAPVRSKQFFLRNYARVVSPLRRSQPRRSDDVQVQHLPESRLDILANWVPAPPLAFNLRWAGCIQHSDTGRGRKDLFWGYLGISWDIIDNYDVIYNVHSNNQLDNA